MITAKLTYFKASGKYYSSGEMEVDGSMALYEIWDHIEAEMKKGKWPGLVDGQHDFHTVIEVPEHRHAHPHLVVRR